MRTCNSARTRCFSCNVLSHIGQCRGQQCGLGHGSRHRHATMRLYDLTIMIANAKQRNHVQLVQLLQVGTGVVVEAVPSMCMPIHIMTRVEWNATSQYWLHYAPCHDAPSGHFHAHWDVVPNPEAQVVKLGCQFPVCHKHSTAHHHTT